MTEEKEVDGWGIGMIEWCEGITWSCPFCDPDRIQEMFAGDACPKCGAVVKLVAVKP